MLMLHGAVVLGPVLTCGCHQAIVKKARSEFSGMWQGMIRL